MAETMNTEPSEREEAPERIWINSGAWWSKTPYPTGGVEYVRADLASRASVAAVEGDVAQRRLQIALDYIKRAANRELPKLPCRVDKMTEREVAIFNVGAAAVGNLQFIARELDALPDNVLPVGQGNTFDDWYRREDYGDREQLERCWASAQNAAATTSPETPVGGEVQKCVKCSHNQVGLSGHCIHQFPDHYGNPQGGYLCGCKCEFAAAALRTREGEGK